MTFFGIKFAYNLLILLRNRKLAQLIGEGDFK